MLFEHGCDAPGVPKPTHRRVQLCASGGLPLEHATGILDIFLHLQVRPHASHVT